MTAEKLHDAIGLLPSDLIAETDKKRCAKPKVIHWTRYAAMAACFVLVLGCSLFATQVFAPKGATESMAEAPAAAAPMEQVLMGEPADEAAAQEEAAPEAAAASGTTTNGSFAEDTASALPTASEPEEIRYGPGCLSRRVETPLKPSTACFSSSATVTLIHSRTELETYLSEKDWIYDFTAFPAVCKDDYDEDWFAEHDLLLTAVLAVPSGSDPYVSALNQNEDIWELCIAYNLTMTEEDSGSTVWHFLVEVEKDQIPDAESVTLIFE